jgi:hypothetical protein
MAVALAIGAPLVSGAMAMAQPATGRVAPYCIATGGGEGSGYRTGRCQFFDYQQCLQAAASGGNCVQNIDYHGEPQPASAPSRRRR